MSEHYYAGPEHFYVGPYIKTKLIVLETIVDTCKDHNVPDELKEYCTEINVNYGIIFCDI